MDALRGESDGLDDRSKEEEMVDLPERSDRRPEVAVTETCQECRAGPVRPLIRDWLRTLLNRGHSTPTVASDAR